MKLHIIIVALNNALLTTEAVRSIVSPIDYTLHLLDQESSETFEACNAIHAVEYHRFSPRVPLAKAWNYGMQQALRDSECQYIVIANNDILFHPTTLTALMKGKDQLQYAMVTAENVAPRYSVEAFYQHTPSTDLTFDSRPITNWREEGPDFSLFMVGREFVSQAGWFDENYAPAYCEDLDTHVRIIKEGYHAKRLTTAPYFHYGSRTLVSNAGLAPEIHQGHEKNKAYYRAKWGAEHPEVLDGRGFNTPFNDPTKNIRYWEGVEAYET